MLLYLSTMGKILEQTTLIHKNNVMQRITFLEYYLPIIILC